MVHISPDKPLTSTAVCILASAYAKTILIIGAGIEQVPAYTTAKGLGLFVIGTDIDPEAPGLKLADHTIIASTRDADATLEGVRQVVRHIPIHGVMTMANDVPFTVAVVAEALGLKGISVRSAGLVRDKLLMKQAFEQNHVACPWFSSVADVSELKRFIETQPNKKFVIKPVDGRGARGVLLIDSESDLEWAYSEAQRWGETGRLILEEFAPGIQLSTESFLIDGVAHTPAMSERNYEYLERFSPNIIENGGTIPALLSKEEEKEVNRLIERGAAALGVSEGVVKGDIVLSPCGEPLIIELALRLSGGWFASHQIPAATGVDLVKATIEYSVGLLPSVQKLTPAFYRATATRYWFPAQGKILKISGTDCLDDLPGLIEYGFFRSVGDIQPEVRMHPDRFGYLMVEAASRDVAVRRAEDGIDMLTVVTQ